MLSDYFKPKRWAEVIGNENVIHTLQKIIKAGSTPNLILCGGVGSGKSSIIDLYGEDLERSNKIHLKEKINCKATDSSEKLNNFLDISNNFTDETLLILEDMEYLSKKDMTTILSILDNRNGIKCAITTSILHKLKPSIVSNCIVFTLQNLNKELLKEKLFRKTKFTNLPVEITNEIIERYYPDIRNILNNIEKYLLCDNEVTIMDIDFLQIKVKAINFYNHLSKYEFNQCLEILSEVSVPYDFLEELVILLTSIYQKNNISFTVYGNTIDIIGSTIERLRKGITNWTVESKVFVSRIGLFIKNPSQKTQ